ncbi:single-stranded-DNA-specific exonuclease RecJ [Companilactobacillus metriopterae]|uniref:single-stranded-DNA-specific exonuclease RecJ n=1 Tax=Companilactobacillus metriopterae TaxID=1909267 RepID=UPI00100B5502|nr:single-stranded-DNA-specific exonuclease RecJ [Companilactobacillus metriopterae]
MINKVWKKRKELSSNDIDDFSQKFQQNKIVSELLLERDFNNPEAITEFLNPDINGLQDPFGLNDMDKALELIDDAVENQKKVVIYGDYDADGVTSTSIMYLTLKKMGLTPEFYIPDRFQDGYGPNLEAYKRIVERGVDLLITVDNGVSGKEEIKFLKDQGISVLISDHHDLPDELPEADAIVHPRIPGFEYVCPNLSGAGVAFKIADAILGEEAIELIDLAAIGTVADSVDLSGENRIIVANGLKQLQKSTNLGISTLVKSMKIKPSDIDEETIGFQIAPRINALGRVENASSAVELFTTSDASFSKELADETEEVNTRRQDLVEIAYNASLNQIDDQIDNPVLVLHGDDWHQGILGIVASRVVGLTNKPTLVMSLDKNENLYKGSGRSPEGFNLFEAMNKYRELLSSFGGHSQACGFSIDVDNLDEFQEKIQAEVANQNFDVTADPEKIYDLELSVNQLTLELIESISKLAPFGYGNPKPVIQLKNVTIDQPQAIGKDKSHIKFFTRQNVHQVGSIGFKMFKEVQEISNQSCDVYGTLGINEWAGKKNLQLMVQGVQVSQSGIKIKNLKETYIDYRNKQLSKPLLEHFDSIVFFNDIYLESAKKNSIDVNLAKYDQDFSDQNILIYDRPHDLDLLKHFVENNNTSHTALYFHTNLIQRYAKPDEIKMKELLKYIYTHERINTASLDELANYLKIEKNNLDFYLNVFFELDFVRIEDGFVEKANSSKQRSLQESQAFLKRLKRNDVEKILIESNFDDLLIWLSDYDCHC